MLFIIKRFADTSFMNLLHVVLFFSPLALSCRDESSNPSSHADKIIYRDSCEISKKVVKSTMSKDKPKTMCTLRIVILHISKVSPPKKKNPVLLGIAMGSLQGQVRVYHRCLKSVA